MRRSLVLTASLLYLAAAACSRGGAGVDTASGLPAHSDSGAAATLLGNWELRRIPPRSMPGLSLTLQIDSTRGARYFGRLIHYFAGDVGQDPSDYEAFADSIRRDDHLIFTIRAVDRRMLGMVMAGRLTADTVELETFVLGPDTLSDGPFRWILVRGR